MENLFKNIENEFDDIVDYIKTKEDYKKYVAISKKLKNNKEIMDLIENVKVLQRKIIRDKSNKDAYEKEIDEILKKLNEYPIYVEFLIYQEKINEEIQSVKGIIQEYFDNITK